METEIVDSKVPVKDRLKKFGKKWAPIIFGGVAVALVSFDLGKRTESGRWINFDSIQDDSVAIIENEDGSFTVTAVDNIVDADIVEE